MPSHLSAMCCVCIILVILCGTALAAPRTRRQSMPWHKIIVDECKEKESIKATCQLCAKETKSNIVYPMCCEGREAARLWCERYLSYGLKQETD